MGRLAVGFLFLAFPILEMAVLIKTGQRIGFWATLALLVGAGVVGSLIMSRQSLAALRRTQESMAQGKPPVAPMIDSLFLLLAGMLLIIPGLISDALALLLLIPPLRRAVARWSVRRMMDKADVQVKVYESASEPWPRPATPGQAPNQATGPVIEGEFERLGETTREPRQLKERE